MQYRTYGQTGKQVSVIGFGGMRFEDPKDTKQAVELVHYAYERGVNYFDTAPAYCNDLSESLMGEAFRDMDRDSFFVSTKSGAPQGDALRRDLEKSLERMGIEKIDFFHIWGVLSLEAWEQRKRGGAVAAALKAREEGLVEHVVFSTHMPGEEMLSVFEEHVMEGVTLGYNAINFPLRKRGLQGAAAAGLGVVTMNPLGGGLIPQFEEKFQFIKKDPADTIVQAALRFNLSHAEITSCLVGFKNREEVDAALKALDQFEPYGGEEVKRMEQEIEDAFDGLCTGCQYCMPCPAGLMIPQLMDGYNHMMLYHDEQQVINRMHWHWWLKPETAAACTECGECEDKCTQHLPIIERMKEMAKLKSNW